MLLFVSVKNCSGVGNTVQRKSLSMKDTVCHRNDETRPQGQSNVENDFQAKGPTNQRIYKTNVSIYN